MSALVNKAYDMSNLIVFNQNGLEVASFVDIKKVLIQRARALYGSDIDISDASVDGQWINEQALLINNILQVLNSMYASLEPSVAKGTALDILASFSNISRKSATASVCNVDITNTSTTDKKLSISKDTKFVDKNGLTWSIDQTRISYSLNANNAYDIDFKPNEAVIIPLVCDDLGPTSIYANTISGFMEINNDFADLEVTQPDVGTKGTYNESDESLRARRSNSAANESTTVLEGIQGALISNSAIVDAKAINHTEATADGLIAAHTVEVIVRRRYQNADSDQATLDGLDKIIADIVHNKLTPGIPTSYNSTNAANALVVHSNQIKYCKFAEIGISDKTYVQTIYWANCKPISSTIAVTLHKYDHFSAASACESIINRICSYCNALQIMEDMTESRLLQNIIYADAGFQGKSTYYATSQDITIGGESITNNFSSTSTGSAKHMKSCYAYDDAGTAYQLANDASGNERYGNAETEASCTIIITIKD